MKFLRRKSVLYVHSRFWIEIDEEDGRRTVPISDEQRIKLVQVGDTNHFENTGAVSFEMYYSFQPSSTKRLVLKDTGAISRETIVNAAVMALDQFLLKPRRFWVKLAAERDGSSNEVSINGEVV